MPKFDSFGGKFGRISGKKVISWLYHTVTIRLTSLRLVFEIIWDVQLIRSVFGWSGFNLGMNHIQFTLYIYTRQ